MIRQRFILAVAVCAVITGAFILVDYLLKHDSTVSVSPNGTYKIVVRESRWKLIDRNFHVILTNLNNGDRSVIFRSWDQSPTIKSEQFVWSADSRKVALVGDNYYVVENSALSNDRIVFLAYDVDTQRLYCNTAHDRGFMRIPASDARRWIGNRIVRQPD